DGSAHRMRDEDGAVTEPPELRRDGLLPGLRVWIALVGHARITNGVPGPQSLLEAGHQAVVPAVVNVLSPALHEQHLLRVAGQIACAPLRDRHAPPPY